MRLTFNAADITSPTYETLEEYATKRLVKVRKYLPKDNEADYELRTSVKLNNGIFDTTLEVVGMKNTVVSVRDRDMRKCIDEAQDLLIRNLRKIKEKKIGLRRIKAKFVDIVST
ncbi:MAG: HPF/RaiA family ribosome-associated protein [Candidatus Dojkabacteria bacterium]|nr:HPF/RaiA family ribosome-associated protein [Candidatus Dojkabacteria bacterium]MDQ7021228.1 HPF/RaiA family ribosome-associated protein [Candidatus Dojkabacteria bacterium]